LLSGEGKEKYWRNNINTVASFLKEYHHEAYRVWNLTESAYDYAKFENRVVCLGFPDHHPPPLDLLFKIILSLHEWLMADGLNVAAIHCLGEWPFSRIESRMICQIGREMR
jgi:phosphatidylinositol-3,4,5-trisphosphate 3-phosphatase/dual-specificity protein phosphatase PTEN